MLCIFKWQVAQRIRMYFVTLERKRLPPSQSAVSPKNRDIFRISPQEPVQIEDQPKQVDSRRG